jgi:hypothetical protein
MKAFVGFDDDYGGGWWPPRFAEGGGRTWNAWRAPPAADQPERERRDGCEP